jgi:hypothetical protein
MGQAFDLPRHLISGERLESFNDTGMEHPPPFQQEAVIGHLVGEGMLEGIDPLRE